MYSEPRQAQHHANVDHRYAARPETSSAPSLASQSHMDRGTSDYTQTGLPSPYPSNFGDNSSEASPAAHAPTAQYPVKQEVNYAPSTAPASPYGVYPASVRSGSLNESQLPRTYHPANTTGAASMAQQQQNSPSMPQHQQDGTNHQTPAANNSDNGTQIDPSIAQPSPTYAYSQQPPYPPNPEMPHGYSPHPGGPMYAQPRPDWGGYGGHGAPPNGRATSRVRASASRSGCPTTAQPGTF